MAKAPRQQRQRESVATEAYPESEYNVPLDSSAGAALAWAHKQPLIMHAYRPRCRVCLQSTHMTPSVGTAIWKTNADWYDEVIRQIPR